MRKNFGPKPIIYPMPVLIVAAYDGNGLPCAMNAAWGGIGSDTQIALCLDSGHRTTKNILERRAFTVAFGTADRVAECDYLGIVSGNKVEDKIARAGLTVRKSGFVDAPLINELPAALECTLVSYDPETCLMIGEIVNAGADESVLGENGLIDPIKLAPITFDPMNHVYLRLGEAVGRAFGEGRKIG